MLVVAPGDYLSLYETLDPMRTQISFKQFNPTKSAKYGLVFKSVKAARYPYTFISSPYSGKPTVVRGQYYIQGTEAIVHYLIETLSANSRLAGRNFSFNQLYTSIPLAKWLLQKQITCIGTMKLNRKGIPDELKENKNRELLSSEIYWDGNSPLLISLILIFSKHLKGKQNVILLSTTPPILGITKDDGKSKLGIYKVHDFTKGGTDIIDQRLGFYTCKPKSRKLTITVFSFVIDMARVNLSTTFGIQKKYDPCKQDSFEYCRILLYQLVKPFIESRNFNGLTTLVRQNIELVIGKR